MGMYHAHQSLKPTHDWLQTIRVSYVPGPATPLLEEVVSNLLEHFRLHGHVVQERPDDSTDILLTTAPFGHPLGWREALLFTARRRFNLHRTPTILTLVQTEPERIESLLKHFERALSRPEPDPKDFEFSGMAPDAYKTLVEQGQHGGPILALERVLQSQSKSIRVLLVIGWDQPLYAYHFDLVGAYPRSQGDEPQAFYDDIVLRLVTVASTHEVTEHQVLDYKIPRSLWDSLSTPESMHHAGRELGKLGFFTEMVLIERLVHVPAVSDAVASQYSEGCFATWDPKLSALIATITGSSRPVDKTDISEDDLAVIVAVRPDGQGAVVRHVEDHRNDPPSSEAVEMIDMDTLLPRIQLGNGWEFPGEAPVARSKLHGHRGISAYDPSRVEFVPLDPPYYHYPVSCATEAQARGIKAAFSRSQALQNPDDPRQVVFTVLPGHGVVMVEKWVPGKSPFQVLWETMDAGYLRVSHRLPQGPMAYRPAPDGRMVLEE
ncbi:MAG: hypothetical protein KKC71_00260 [Chloroflexi bacterium]|nr:hypothetical protein [Chloroflexota bacterium]